MKSSKAEKLLKSYKPLQLNLKIIQRQVKANEILYAYDENSETEAAINDLKTKYDAALSKLVKQNILIEKIISTVDDFNQQAVLRLRYIEGLRWRDVSKRMNYCTDHCIRKANTAIRKIDELLNNSAASKTDLN